MIHRRTVPLLAVGVATALVALPGQAFAKPSHHPKPTTNRFSADGLIIAANSSSLRVLASTLHVGRSTATNRVITVHLSTRRTHRPAPTAGYHITVAGKAVTTGTATTYTATAPETTQPNPAGVYLGTLTALTGALAQISNVHATDPHGDDNEHHPLTADTSGATITVDGAPGALTVGQFLVVLGERSHGSVVAATVYAYSTTPALLGGEIHTVSGTTVTLGEDDNPTVVDLAPGGAPIPILLNGTTTITPDQLTPDTKILITGQTVAAVFTPTQAFAFDDHDTNPCGHNDD